MFAASLPVYSQNDLLSRMDSVEVGLLTCSPHQEVYSLYGHTALHWHDLRTGEHWVFNYGVFDYKKPHFVWRFILGQTDYMLECTGNLKRWCDYYRKWGSEVKEQVLDLTPAEKLRLQAALATNLRSPVYRYNFFYDNCSTRPRDMIERCLEGTVDYAVRKDYEPSFRQMIHQCTEDHPWTAFGNDLLLGLNADKKTTQRERQFLPADLSWDFDHATVDRQGVKRPLVSRLVTHVPQGQQPVKKGFPLSPHACTLLLLLMSVAVFAYERWKKRILVWWDVLLMLTSGLAGCVLLMMVFSEHPATSLNLQLLLLNPLALLFIPAVARRRKTRWFNIMLGFIVAFLIGGLWQHYAEGMYFVALCLLLRYWTHHNDK
ncbi:MAG: DUF4105 domain-containing protein [Prevotella sp.]|nr:DUF4105 domain-containing protein [Prevotella sp.]